MPQLVSPLISASELKQLMRSRSIILIDASNGPNAYSNYLENHLIGARYVDLNTQLADIHTDVSFGGRHPLPKAAVFAQFLGEIGISPDNHVVIYDDKNGSNAAARFWWMLKSLGHEKVQVLDGGMNAVNIQQLPMSSKIDDFDKKSTYPGDKWLLPLIEMEELARISENEEYLVIDVRDAARYRGEVEPIDLIAGHIPGAINVPFTENLAENGMFLPSEILSAKYQDLFKNKRTENIIFHCGSGVTACHTILAMAHAKLPLPRLYVGSWSEWSRNEH